MGEVYDARQLEEAGLSPVEEAMHRLQGAVEQLTETVNRVGRTFQGVLGPEKPSLKGLEASPADFSNPTNQSPLLAVRLNQICGRIGLLVDQLRGICDRSEL